MFYLHVSITHVLFNYCTKSVSDIFIALRFKFMHIYFCISSLSRKVKGVLGNIKHMQIKNKTI